jgi:hypothetical protein
MRIASGVRQWACGVLAVTLGAALAGCAPRIMRLPTDPGAPFPDFMAVHAQVSSACAGARTWQAELGLSGRAGQQRLRGRVHAGFDRPASMRLEAVAFGTTVFIMAARDGDATLLLPRERRVLEGVPPEDILGALTGVALAPADLLAALTGCVVPAPQATGGRLHRGGWASIALGEGATLFLRRRGNEWMVDAARRDGWHLEYRDWMGGFPRSVRLRSEEQGVDLFATVSQLAVNTGFPPAAFELAVPPGTFPLTLDELRAAGPLRDDQ